MNQTQNLDKTVIKKESKNKIRADFERSPLKERLKARFLNLYFLGNIVWWIFRLVLLIGISYVVLFPFLTQIAGSVMSRNDFVDVTVRLIPKNFTLEIYEAILTYEGFWNAFGNSFLMALLCGVFQTLVCALIGYGFAKFKFKGRNLIFMLVMLTMIVPHQTLRSSMFLGFRYFDVLGIVRLLKGGGIQMFGHNIMELGEGVAAFFESLNVLPDKIELFEYTKLSSGGRAYTDYRVKMDIGVNGINLLNSYFPMALLSLSGLAFKNGLYIFLLRQFFRGIPDELEESAYMDGSGTFRTFVQIILPLSVPMLITVFMFSFCWQWTDQFYKGLFFTSQTENLMLVDLYTQIPASLSVGLDDFAGRDLYISAIRNTWGLVIIAPLVVLYAFGQKFLVQGIEQSGLAN